MASVHGGGCADYGVQLFWAGYCAPAGIGQPASAPSQASPAGPPWLESPRARARRRRGIWSLPAIFTRPRRVPGLTFKNGVPAATAPEALTRCGTGCSPLCRNVVLFDAVTLAGGWDRMKEEAGAPLPVGDLSEMEKEGNPWDEVLR